MTLRELASLMDAWQDHKVLVVGDAMLDVEIHGNYVGPSPEGGGPVLSEQKILRFPGGAANVAMNLKALGARVKLLAPIGLDESGDWLKAKLLEEKIPWIPTYFPCRNSWPTTTTKTRVYRDGREMLCRIDRDAHLILASNLVCRVVEAESFELVVLSDYQKGCFAQNPQHFITRLRTQRPNTRITANPKPILVPQLKGIDLISLNQREFADTLQGGESHDALERRLHVRYVLETLGAGGLYISVGPNHLHHSSGHRFSNPDPVGAGDATFAAASLALLVTEERKIIAEIANAAGAAKVLKSGTRPVTTIDVEGILARRPPLEL